MAAADAEVSSRKHHEDSGLAGVVKVVVVQAGSLAGWQDDRDRRGRRRHVPRVLPRLGELQQLGALGGHDEVPGLTVVGRWRPPTSLKDALKVSLGDRPLAERSYVAPGPDCIPGLHAPNLAPLLRGRT